jgi:hypothetical protein
MTSSTSRTEAPSAAACERAFSVVALDAGSDSGKATLMRYLATTAEPGVHSGVLCPRGRELEQRLSGDGEVWYEATSVDLTSECALCPDCQHGRGRVFRLAGDGRKAGAATLPWRLTVAQIGGDEVEARLASLLTELGFAECDDPGQGDSADPPAQAPEQGAQTSAR